MIKREFTPDIFAASKSQTPEYAAALLAYNAAGFKCMYRYGKAFLVHYIKRNGVVAEVAVSENMYDTGEEVWRNCYVPESFDDTLMWLRGILEDNEVETLPVASAQNMWFSKDGVLHKKGAVIELHKEGWRVTFLNQTVVVNEMSARYPMTLGLLLTFLLACGYREALENLNFVTPADKHGHFNYGKPSLNPK